GANDSSHLFGRIAFVGLGHGDRTPTDLFADAGGRLPNEPSVIAVGEDGDAVHAIAASAHPRHEPVIAPAVADDLARYVDAEAVGTVRRRGLGPEPLSRTLHHLTVESEQIGCGAPHPGRRQ